MRRSLIVLLLNVALVITWTNFAWAQGTVNSRTQAGDGTAITNTTAGRLDVTTQAAIQANAGTNLNTSALLLDATFTGRLPAAFSSADNIAAQTATAIHGLMLGWDGAGGNWDRLRVDASGNLNVNLNANAFGTLTVTANAGTNLNTSALLLDATYTGRTPAGASPADNESNTNTALSRVGNFNFIFDGATWDRWTGAITGTVTANAGTNLNTSALALDATLTNRFPAGSTPADNESNSITATRLGLYTFIFDGSTWDRWTGAVTQSGTWNITNISGTVSLPTGASTLAEQQTQTTALQLIDNLAAAQAADNSANSTAKLPTLPARANAAAPSWTEGNQVPLSTDLAGNLRVNSTGGGLTDNSAFTAGSSTESPAGIVYNDTLATLNSGVTAAIRGTMYRAPYMTLMQGTGLETGTVQNPLNVNLANVGAIVSQSSLFDPRFSSTAQITTLDPWGNLKAVSTITDGTRVAALRGQEGAQVVDAGVVVHQSPAPALQCPFVQFISQTASTTLVTNGGKSWLHVCLFSLVSATAQSISLVEGTGTTCGTGTTALYGGTSASAALMANGGLHGISDRITLPMQKAGDNLCLLQSGAGNVSGTLVYGIY